jgi:hypothetical protein
LAIACGEGSGQETPTKEAAPYKAPPGEARVGRFPLKKDCLTGGRAYLGLLLLQIGLARLLALVTASHDVGNGFGRVKIGRKFKAGVRERPACVGWAR